MGGVGLGINVVGMLLFGSHGHAHSDSGHAHSGGGHAHSDNGHVHSDDGHDHSDSDHAHTDGVISHAKPDNSISQTNGGFSYTADDSVVDGESGAGKLTKKSDEPRSADQTERKVLMNILPVS